MIIPVDKAILVLTRAQFIEALKRSKAWRRQLARQAQASQEKWGIEMERRTPGRRQTTLLQGPV